MKTSDIMTLGAATVHQDASLLKAVEMMVNHRISALPVVDSNQLLCGILTEGDVIQAIESLPATSLEMPEASRKKTLSAFNVREFMSEQAITVDPNSSVDAAVALMKEKSLKRLPVVADGKVLGLLSRSDILGALVE
jgi:CBS domain-containing protein